MRKYEIDDSPKWHLMSLAVGAKHFENVYDWTTKILRAIDRCGLNEQYWISTKGSGTIIVIHCEDHFFEGSCKAFAEAAEKVSDAAGFIGLVEKDGILERGEYPWINFKEDGNA